MGEMKKGVGEENFDLESKHVIFAYQVFQQSKKKKSEVGLVMQKVKLDSYL